MTKANGLFPYYGGEILPAKQIRLGLAVLVSVLLVVGCSGPSSSPQTTAPARTSIASTETQQPADNQTQPTAPPPAADSSKADVQQKLGMINTFLRENYTGTTWFSQFSEVKLSTSGTSATLTVLTKLTPKDSNKESAKNACRGVMMSGVETLGATKITIEVLADGRSTLTRCWADVANGKLATPMQFSN